MHRQIALLGVIQMVCIFIGFFALGIVLKAFGYPDTVNDPVVQLSPLAIFLREKGLFLIVLPLIWGIYASVSFHIQKGLLSSPVATVISVIISICILLVFLWACIRPISVIHIVQNLSSAS